MEGQNKNAVAIREDLLTTPLYPLENVRLVGSRCKDCGEVMLGVAPSCGNCAGTDLDTISLGKRGTLWTYTIMRNCPPGDYRGQKDPFVPYAEGLVELPEGIRVLSVLNCDIDEVKIGMELEMEAFEYYTDEEGRTVVAFRFKKA